MVVMTSFSERPRPPEELGPFHQSRLGFILALDESVGGEGVSEEASCEAEKLLVGGGSSGAP